MKRLVRTVAQGRCCLAIAAAGLVISARLAHAQPTIEIVPDSVAAPVVTSAVPGAGRGGGPAPAAGLLGSDTPNDAGREIDLTWRLSADDSAGMHRVSQYYIERATAPAGPWSVIDSVSARTAGY